MATDQSPRSYWADEGNPAFLTTRWSTVMGAADTVSPQAEAALERLCKTYWPPVYSYVRRQGFDAHEAQDLTQEFLCRLIAKRELPKATPEKGRFRFFLLLRLKHFLVNEWERLRAEKRGGGLALISLDGLNAEQRYALEPSHELTPERLFERRWAVIILEKALANLRDEWTASGRSEPFDDLKEFLQADSDTEGYESLGADLGVSAGALRVTVHRLRQRWRELVRAEIADTVAGPGELETEMRHLINAMRTG